MLIYGKLAEWVNYSLAALALIWFVLYVSQRGRNKVLKDTVVKQGMIKADAVIHYQVWPPEGKDNDEQNPDIGI